MKNKQMKTLIVVGLLVLVLVVVGSFAWMIYTRNATAINKIKAGELDLVLDDETASGIKITNAMPISYQQGITTTEYNFKLINNGLDTVNYDISLEDLEDFVNDNNETITMTSENKIADQYVRYILLKDGEEKTAAKSNLLSNTTNRVMSSGVIAPKQTINYTLQIWIDSKAGDNGTENEIMGKYFNTRIKVDTSQSSEKRYNLVFDGNGGESKNLIKSENGPIGELPTTTREGYSFLGWFTEIEGGEQITSETEITEASMKFYAHWSINQYTVTFDGNGGTNIDSITADYGTPLGALNDSARDGYTFIGWFTEQEGGTQVTAESTIPGEDTIYYAHWKAIQYTVEFNGNGGTNGTSITKDCGAPLGTLPTSEREGYTFVGWFTEQEGGTQVTATDLVPYNGATYYAHWTPAPFTVTYNYLENGGTSATKTTDTVNYLSNIDLTPTAVKEGYTFVGWNTSANATSGLSELTMGTSNTTLYAIFKKTLTVTFNKNGAASQTTSDGISSSEATVTESCDLYNNLTSCEVTAPTITASTNTPSVYGYAEDADAHTSTWNQNTSKVVTANATYYAQTYAAEKVLTVTFTRDENSVESIGSTAGSCTIAETYNGTVQDASCIASAKTPSFTVKEGYVALGWFLPTNTTTTPDLAVNANVELTESVTYIAKGRAAQASEVSYDSNATGLKDPTTGATCTDTQCALDAIADMLN